MISTRAASTFALVSGVVVACGGSTPSASSPASAPSEGDESALVHIAEACARLASCSQTHDPPRVRDPSACVDWWLASVGGDDPLHGCLARSASCGDVTRCLHPGDAAAAKLCAERRGVLSTCDGDRLVTCAEGDVSGSTTVDCAKLGARCREVKAAGGLLVRGCFAPDKCPADAPEARCDGDVAVVACHDGAIERATCPPGTRCEERRDESGQATASCEVPDRVRCGGTATRGCDGDRLVECAPGDGDRLRVSDCARFGLRCAGTGPRSGCYVAHDVECDRDMLPKCEGGAIVFCAAGRLVKLSCTHLGLGTCNPSARGPLAACEAPREERAPRAEDGGEAP